MSVDVTAQLSPIDKHQASSNTSRNILHKRSNHSIQQLKLPDPSTFSSTSPSPSPSPSPTFHKYTERKFNQLNKAAANANTNNNNNNNIQSSAALMTSSSSSSISNIANTNNAFTLASSSASTMSSSQMFQNSGQHTASSIAPFGSYYTPTPNTFTQNPATSNFVSAHGHEKLSLSSADSSSSAPNSPPPNYDEVFDSSSATGTFNFIASAHGDSRNGQNAAMSGSTSHNCYDNKTYFQRFDSQLSSSMNSLKGEDKQQQSIQLTSRNLKYVIDK